MDLALSSSTVLGAAVLVWLLWVAPYLTRLRRSERPVGGASLLMEAATSGPAPAREAYPATVADGDRPFGAGPTPEAPPRAEPTVPALAADVSSPSGRQPVLRIRWGRMAVALTGLAAFVAAAVTLVLLIVGLPGWVPGVCAATAVASVATLRTLAVRDRKRRVDEAFRAAIEANRAEAAAPARFHGSSEVFDAGRGPEPEPRPVSREELRALALEVAKASEATAAEAAKASGETEAWEPVDVPRPSYLDAAKAERPEPEPLEVSADSKPEGRAALQAKPEAPEPGTLPGVPAFQPRPGGRTGALGNLDEVLQRRRA
ncbi:hypothetical protein GCM10027449_24570 [Sinomonas notoginsengisoli]|uniref:hypothetical protein n=1 Tax=Sinomonas notoginsengisoli TaxID=1457311 RepID=UPI001F288D0D|nr:hypothetical protein [Sinomonas notoginsengisoli]